MYVDLSNKVKNLNILIEQYNKDWYYGFNDFKLEFQIYQLNELVNSNTEEEKKSNDEDRAILQKEIEELKRRLTLYYHKEDIDNLSSKDNTDYTARLNALKGEIITEIEHFHIGNKLMCLKEFYDKKFI